MILDITDNFEHRLSELFDWMSENESVLVGSYALEVAMWALGATPCFQAANINVFFVPNSPGDVDKLPGMRQEATFCEIPLNLRTSASAFPEPEERLPELVGPIHYEMRASYENILHGVSKPVVFTTFVKRPDAGMILGGPKIDFVSEMRNSVDYRAFAVSVHVNSNQRLILTIERPDEIMTGELFRTGTITSADRIRKWDERGFFIGEPVASENPEYKPDPDEFDPFICLRGETIRLTEAGKYSFLSCREIVVLCEHVDARVTFDATYAKFVGKSNQVKVRGSYVEFEPRGMVRAEYEPESPCAAWLPKMWYRPGISGLIDAGNGKFGTAGAWAPVASGGSNAIAYYFRNGIRLLQHTGAPQEHAIHSTSTLSDAWYWPCPDYRALAPFSDLQIIFWGQNFLVSRNYSKFARDHIIRSHLEGVREATYSRSRGTREDQFLRIHDYSYEGSYSHENETLLALMDALAFYINVPDAYVAEVKRLSDAYGDHCLTV
jgi:hypothetical protein